MTEVEWRNCTDPTTMLAYLADSATQRKLRLFVCASCRMLWQWLPDDRSREAVETGELYADGLVSSEKLKVAREAAWSVYQQTGDGETAAWSVVPEGPTWVYVKTGENWQLAQDTTMQAALEVVRRVGTTVGGKMCAGQDQGKQGREGNRTGHSDRILCNLLRDIFSNQFYCVKPQLSWLTPNVLSLAQTIYHDRAFRRLPVLADALQDVGCENTEILNHCRESSEHVRGCWVVDLILGKN